jgi:hypothetical protein
MKECSVCKVTKPLDSFYKSPRGTFGRYQYCKKCSNEKTNAWRKRNPEADAAIRERTKKNNPFGHKASRLKSSYGITREQYEQMLQRQGGVCAVSTCGKEILSRFSAVPAPLKLTACVDHNHATGAVRALLCQRCNYVVGVLESHPGIVRAGDEYLRAFETC